MSDHSGGIRFCRHLDETRNAHWIGGRTTRQNGRDLRVYDTINWSRCQQEIESAHRHGRRFVFHPLGEVKGVRQD